MHSLLSERHLPWLSAYTLAGDLARPLPAELITAAAAVGRVLAAPLRAATPVPAFDSAAMDGYATSGAGPWTVTGRLLAGQADVPAALVPGTAAEIATGARIPAGADAVLPYERCRRDGQSVSGQGSARDHIRRAGESLRTGDLLVPAGRTVTATVAAAAVQAGVERLSTHRRPVVTLLVTGDEVITRGTPGPGQVRDSFTGLVAAITDRAGGLLALARQVPDDPAVLRAALNTTAHDAATDNPTGGEVIVVSGSSSAGAADHLHTVLTELGAVWHVRGVACRPGHPQALASLPDGRWVVSLPGNPYAGLVAALTLLEPLLRTLAGRPATPLPTLPVTGSATLVDGGVRIVPVHRHAAGWIVAPAGSASLHVAAAADALAVLPSDWAAGEAAAVLAIP